MTQICWAALLICFCSNSESTIIIKEPGENITLKCSSEGCLQSTEKYTGMYLYHSFIEETEVYFCGTGSPGKIVVRSTYKGRVEPEGTPMNYDITVITITNLTVDDSGVYTCVYKQSVDKPVNCNVYTVFVRGVAPCPTQEVPQITALPAVDSDLPLALSISVCVLSMLLIAIFILLIIQRVKQKSSCRRSARSSQQESNDYVYEVMSKKNLHPAAGSQQLSQSPYEFA